MFFKLLLILPAVISVPDRYGYFPYCPNTEAPVILTEGAINKHMYTLLQVHEPETSQQIAYLHRKRYTMNIAARSIGTDPVVDFKRRKTAVFMDGYMDSQHLITARVLVSNWAYMGYNTLAVDAQALYSQAYPLVIRTGYQVGNVTARLLKDLMPYGLRAKDITLVGVSLGGQTVSLVAKHFKRLTGQKVNTIFSLDPSGPCYRGIPPDYRLSPTDADMVQVIHTNSDAFGMGDAQGHLDFYINGGEWQHIFNTDQPGCDDFCSHFTCSLYLYTSLRLHQDKFVGVKCKNAQQAREHKCYDNEPLQTNLMGFKADYSKPGIYYVPVRAEAPMYVPDWKSKIVYPLVYSDAYSKVKHFVLSRRSLDLNLSPPEFYNRRLDILQTNITKIL